MSKRKPATRRRSSAKSGGSGVWSWMLLFGVAIGGIQVYEHRDSLLPQLKGTVASVSKTISPPSRPATREVASERQKAAPTQTVALPASGAPIPPRAIAMPSGSSATQMASATLPAPRPQVQTVSLTEKPGTFAFCGRSGLNNCVADGNTFWMKGVKMKLSGIDVPNTDQARCLEERQKGFTAKVRLRDMLNAGGFQVASAGGASTLSRSGVSFADQLVREGLARRAGAASQSWCG
ncbi:nuclease [Rhizobium skierniewicense]|uniref:nuclease n=1 Tax=Rhizobium skierniewicense TaxID=984260 RepID=UPI001571FB14|nr:nuclease [Rhizobium skierniewicense]NTF32347.1 nuclease [Rhizobium skierniewicense]